MEGDSKKMCEKLWEGNVVFIDGLCMCHCMWRIHMHEPLLMAPWTWKHQGIWRLYTIFSLNAPMHMSHLLHVFEKVVILIIFKKI